MSVLIDRMGGSRRVFAFALFVVGTAVGAAIVGIGGTGRVVGRCTGSSDGCF